MSDSGINPVSPNATNPLSPQEPSCAGQNVFAKMFPTATPDQVKKIVNNFINYTIQQMKQDQQNMLDALKQMQEDENQ